MILKTVTKSYGRTSERANERTRGREDHFHPRQIEIGYLSVEIDLASDVLQGRGHQSVQKRKNKQERAYLERSWLLTGGQKSKCVNN